MSKVCKNCGTVSDDSFNNCPNCGGVLDQAPGNPNSNMISTTNELSTI